MTLGPRCWFGITCVGGIDIDQIQQKTDQQFKKFSFRIYWS